MSNYSTFKGVNTITLDVTERDGTGSMIAPKGTTLERPASTVEGQLRYNTTIGVYEQYTAVGWISIAAPPAISSISPTTFDGESGTEITINGQAFEAAATVKFVSNDGTEYSAATVTYVNNSLLRATTPQDFTVAQEPFGIKVINSTGLSYTLEDALDCGATPTWSTASGSLGTANNGIAFSTTVEATDPDGGSITYSVTTGSLPTGLSLNSSTGVISGTVTGYSEVTTVNFTITATDNAGNTTPRAFSIYVTINYFGDGSDGALST
jgi:hypothetical protein